MNWTRTAGMALAGAIAAGSAWADSVTLQLKSVTRAQFAGYFVALKNGYFADEGLSVTINPGGPDIVPPQVIADGGADVIVEWMPAALAAREAGLPLVNIAQPFQRSGMMMTCRADTGIQSPQDLRGRTVGVWLLGNEFAFRAWMNLLEIPTSGGPEGVEILPQDFSIEPLLLRQADCITTMSYDEYWQIIDAGVAPDELVTFKYQDHGIATLEDGLWVLADRLDDPEFVARMARFVRASMRGWERALAHPVEAAMVVTEFDALGTQSEDHQIRMMADVVHLVQGSSGRLDPADFERTVAILLDGGADALIAEDPGKAAWTHAVTDLAFR